MWILVLLSLTLPFLLARRRPAKVSVVASTEESS